MAAHSSNRVLEARRRQSSPPLSLTGSEITTGCAHEAGRLTVGVDEGVDDVLVAVDGGQVEGGVSLRTHKPICMHTCIHMHTGVRGQGQWK